MIIKMPSIKILLNINSPKLSYIAVCQGRTMYPEHCLSVKTDREASRLADRQRRPRIINHLDWLAGGETDPLLG